MDHGAQFEREGRVKSQVQMGTDDVCDNLPSNEPLTAQTRNLNETSTLTQTQDEGGRGLFQKASLGNNGRRVDEEEEKDESIEGNGEEDEEDLDEMMREAEEEEEEEELSDGSSSLICCQSPDTPMTDSSYSETGSPLETPYPLSPGTSPEPASPVIPVASPETPYPICPAAVSLSIVKTKSCTPSTGTVSQTFTTRPVDPTTLTVTSQARSPSPPGPTSVTHATDSISNSSLTTEHFTSSTECVFSYGHITSTAETFTVTSCTTRLNSSIACIPQNAATGPLTKEYTNAGMESASSNWEQMTSLVPTCVPMSTCTTRPVPGHELVKSLEQLAQRGDDAHFPQYLHQIAEAFVHIEDYQRALWCIELERLYHQRVLDNLNTLQEQWEHHCKGASPDLASQHLDTLQHICQTHSRPKAEDAACASVHILRPTAEEAAELPPCTTAHQVDGGMEQREEDSSHPHSSHPLIPSCSLADDLNSLDVSDTDREDTERNLEGGGGFHRSQFTDKGGGEAEGAVGHTISAITDELHPPMTGAMEQSKPAEHQGGVLCLAQERERKQEDDGKSTEAMKMEVEGEDEEEEKLTEGDSSFCQKALWADVEEQPLRQEALVESQESSDCSLDQEADLPQEAHMKQQEQGEEDEDEEEQADIITEAASLDDLAKLITVEEISPALGLVSILKKRHVDNASLSASTEHQAEKIPAKRRVRFRVPDDYYEQDVGGGDSCLLLFLLCLVTVVISLGGTALYCSVGDVHSTVCQDFSRNADFYVGQIQRGISHIQHWFTAGS